MPPSDRMTVPELFRVVWVATGEPVTDADLEAIALKEPWARGLGLLRHGRLRGSERRQPAPAR